MDISKLIQLNLEVSASDASVDDIDQMTRQLVTELRGMDVESVELAKGGRAPDGTKSVDPVTIGSIVIAVLPTALPKVVDAIQAWTSRGSTRTVKFKGKVAGQAIEFEGSAEDLHKLLEKLERGKKKG